MMRECFRFAWVAATILAAGTAVSSETTKLRMRNSFLPEDFETRREDGRFDNHMAFAWDYVRRMVPEYSFDKLKDASELPAWRAKVRTGGRCRSIIRWMLLVGLSHLALNNCT